MGFNLTKDSIKINLDKKSRQQVRGLRTSSETLIANDRAYRKLKKSGYVSETIGSTSDTSLALEILNTIGCSVSTEPINMSLLAEQTDTESIDNENIIDQVALANTKNSKTTADDKFVNVDDPFYTLDSAPEEALSIERATLSTQDSLIIVENITADVVTKNLDSSSSTLKQFNFSN